MALMVAEHMPSSKSTSVIHTIWFMAYAHRPFGGAGVVSGAVRLCAACEGRTRELRAGGGFHGADAVVGWLVETFERKAGKKDSSSPA